MKLYDILWNESMSWREYESSLKDIFDEFPLYHFLGATFYALHTNPHSAVKNWIKNNRKNNSILYRIINNYIISNIRPLYFSDGFYFINNLFPSLDYQETKNWLDNYFTFLLNQQEDKNIENLSLRYWISALRCLLKNLKEKNSTKQKNNIIKAMIYGILSHRQVIYTPNDEGDKKCIFNFMDKWRLYLICKLDDEEFHIKNEYRKDSVSGDIGDSKHGLNKKVRKLKYTPTIDDVKDKDEIPFSKNISNLVEEDDRMGSIV